MFRVRSVAVLASAAAISLPLLAITTSDADAKRVRVPLTSVASGAYLANAVSKANAAPLRAANEDLSKADLARQRADKALLESGEKDKTEDEEVMSKAVPEEDTVRATDSAKGEPVTIKPTSKMVCIANCD